MRQAIPIQVKGAIVILVTLPLFFFSCKQKEVAPPPPAKVQVVEVLQTTVPVLVDFVGQTYGYQDIPIRARVDGFLTGMHFTEGSRVNKGQLLYSIDPDPLKAIEAEKMSGLTGARTRLVKAESDLSRIRPLAAINAVSQRDLDAAVAEYEAAQANVSAEEAQLKYSRINLGYTRIMSPIDGIIGRTEAKTGEYVGKAPNPIVLNTVSRIDTILVNFAITESDFLRLARSIIDQNKTGQKTDPADTSRTAKKKITLLLADGTVYDQPGRLNFADRQVDPATGTILIQAAFPNPDQLLRPGLFARIRVVMEEIDGGLIIPQRCVMETQGVYQVYAINANQEVEMKNVRLGPKIGGMWIVEEGLAPGESIIFEGLNLVRPGMKTQPVKVEIPQELKNF